MKVRRSALIGFVAVFGFNSRTREGATNMISGRSVAGGVSIHAPVKVRR